MSDYYKNCAFPKQATKKKKKKQNGWKDKQSRCCRYTGQHHAERHELFYGNPLRQISIDNGFQVDLCQPVHALFHGRVNMEELKKLHIPDMFPEPLEWASEELKKLRQECQQSYEDRERVELRLTSEQARRSWINLVGRNYLD